MIFTTNDKEIIETVATRIIDIVNEDKIIDKLETYSEYIKRQNK